jgi:hypothetical protein
MSNSCVPRGIAMSKDENRADEIDWSLTTWEGARREQARRWARMPLAELILALEEMQVLAEQLSHRPQQARRLSRQT